MALRAQDRTEDVTGRAMHPRKRALVVRTCLCSCTLTLLAGLAPGAFAQHIERPPPPMPQGPTRPVFDTLWLEKRAYSQAELLGLIVSSNPYERQFAAIQLGEIAEDNGIIWKALVKALADLDEDVRFMAVASLSRLGPASTPALIDALSDNRTGGAHRYFPHRLGRGISRQLSVGDLAFAVLSGRALNIEALVDTYRRLSRNARPGELAGVSLQRLGKVSGSSVIHRSAVQRLLLLISSTPPSFPVALLPLLRSGDRPVQEAALLSLGRAPEIPPEIVPALRAIIAFHDKQLVPLAVKALVRANNAESRQALGEAMRSKHAWVRALIMEEIDGSASDAFAYLKRGWDDASKDVRAVAIARAVLPAHLPAYYAGDDEPHRRDWLPYRCEDLRPIKGQDAFRERLSTQTVSRILEERKRRGVSKHILVGALALLGCDANLAPAIVAALVPDLYARDPSSRAFAIDTLGRIARSGHSVPVTPWLRDLHLPRWPEQAFEDALQLITYGQFDGDAVDGLLAQHRRLERGDASAAQRLLAAVSRNTAISPGVRDQVLAALGFRFVGIVAGEPLVVRDAAREQAGPAMVRRLLESGSEWSRTDLGGVLADAGLSPDSILKSFEIVLRANETVLWQRGFVVHAALKRGSPGVRMVANTLRDVTIAASLRNDILRVLATGTPRAMPSDELGVFVTASDLPDHPELNGVLLQIAKGNDSAARAFAILGLARQSGATDELPAILRAAVMEPVPLIRGAAVAAWVRKKLPIGDEILPLLKDPSSEVFRRALWLIPLMREGDPRRVKMLGAALAARGRVAVRDMSYSRLAGVYKYVLDAVLEAGEAGWPVMNAYLATEGVIDLVEIEKLERHVQVLVPGFLARLEQAGKGSRAARELHDHVRARIIAALGTLALKDERVRDRLIALATTGPDEDRRMAAKALSANGFNVWQEPGALIPVLLDMGVRQKARRWVTDALDILYPYLGPDQRERGGDLDLLPEFPWPPPHGFRSIIVPRELLGPEIDTLGKVYDRLSAALSRASSGFEAGLFGVPNGFALIARMERIYADGTPYPDQSRWIHEGTPLVNFSDFLGNLFFEKPGYFRVISFVVTDDVNFTADRAAKLPAIDTGARVMPKQLREAKLGRGQEVLALVYTFERKVGAHLSRWDSGAPSAQQHLLSAGVWPALVSR